jgi:hypothetical protein
MQVDDATGEPDDELLRKDGEVAGEDDDVDPTLLELRRHRLGPGGSRRGRPHRPDQRIETPMTRALDRRRSEPVRDDDRDLRRQLAGHDPLGERLHRRPRSGDEHGQVHDPRHLTTVPPC